MPDHAQDPAHNDSRSADTFGQSGGTPKVEGEKDAAAVELGRRGGLKGGKARAQKLTPEQRSEIARKAAAARWNKA